MAAPLPTVVKEGTYRTVYRSGTITILIVTRKTGKNFKMRVPGRYLKSEW